MYQVNNVLQKELNNIIINELKEIGVKYKEKKAKLNQEQLCRKNIFQTHLHLLELTDVILCNGSAVQIPKLVADACNRVLENVEVEGIFRKAGSSLRQKELRKSLEAGLPITKSHHVIDVANVIKYFFRELPEPLIPSSIQEAMMRCMLLSENRSKAILLICLLMPQLTINTLSFFMQFLKTVSKNSYINKMTTENLAIIFAPGIMPFPDINSQRFNNHVKLLQLLIENAEVIGSIPACIADKLQSPKDLGTCTPLELCKIYESSQKKKKKRKSEMFSGIRKIVGVALGSSENLDNTPEKKTFVNESRIEKICKPQNIHIEDICQTTNTPYIKTTKKRKFTDPVYTFSAKKKKDLFAIPPTTSGGLLPSTPLTNSREMKKSRQSLEVNRQLKYNTVISTSNSVERRWSIVGNGWPRLKNKNVGDKNKFNEGIKSKANNENCISRDFLDASIHNLEFQNSMDIIIDKRSVESENDINAQNVHEIFYTRKESQRDYDAIKERVEAIENRITNEFKKLRDSISQPEILNLSDKSMSGTNYVHSKYEHVIFETDSLCSPNIEFLAKQLSRDLKIHRSVDRKIVHSPSARKIGTLCKQSQERKRLSRTKTWHISSNSVNTGKTIDCVQNNMECSKKILNVANNLEQSTVTNTNCQQSYFLETKFDSNANINNEKWTSADIFFNVTPNKFEDQNLKYDLHTEENSIAKELLCTPIRSTHTKAVSTPTHDFHTPMLPPKSVPKRVLHRTPRTSFVINSCTTSALLPNKHLMSTPIGYDGNGRDSIARLRAQNAGMVMAKAKLFDGMINNTGECTEQSSHVLTKSNCKTIQKTIVNASKVIHKNIDNFNDIRHNTSLWNERKYNSKISNRQSTDYFKQKNTEIEIYNSSIRKNIRSPAVTKHRINGSKKKLVTSTIKPNDNKAQKFNNTVSSAAQLHNRKLRGVNKLKLSPKSNKTRKMILNDSPKSLRTGHSVKHVCIQKSKLDSIRNT